MRGLGRKLKINGAFIKCVYVGMYMKSYTV